MSVYLYTYSDVILNSLIRWSIRNQELHILELDLSRSWTYILGSNNRMITHFCRICHQHGDCGEIEGKTLGIRI